MGERDTPRRRRPDFYVGSQVRRRRKLLNITQAALADQIGVSLQQLQKYEWGQHRISASMLFEIATALETSVGSCFEGLEAAVESDRHLDRSEVVSPTLRFLTEPGGHELIEACLSISSPALRRNLLLLAREVAAVAPCKA